MRRLEIMCLTTSAGERETVSRLLAPFCAEGGPGIRIYRHETHPTELAVHVVHTDDTPAVEALSERIAALLESHGLVSRSRWVVKE